MISPRHRHATGAAATTVLLLALLAGCASPPSAERSLTAMERAAPRSILVLPPLNRSLDVDASALTLATLAMPLGEKGYYVFPVHTVKTVLEGEGLYEPESVHALPASTLAAKFGADAVLYPTINRWDAQYLLVNTTVTVDFSYRIVGKDNTVLWTARSQKKFSPNTGSDNNLLGKIVSAAITRAAPDYMPLTRAASWDAMVNSPNAIPNGPLRGRADGR